MAISDIKEAAEQSGIVAVITNSEKRIESQLNKITGIEELPVMLVSWDLDTDLTFDSNGFLENPKTKVVILLMTKADSKTNADYESSAEDMAKIFIVFIQKLNALLTKHNKLNVPSVTEAGYTLVPRHGLGQHSGIIGRFTMIGEIINCT